MFRGAKRLLSCHSEERSDFTRVIPRPKAEESGPQILRFAQDDQSFAQDDKSFAQDDKSFAQDDSEVR
jgi:hypothetical protein